MSGAKFHPYRPCQFFVPYSGKIADITHADTNPHTLNLATALSETRNIVAVNLWANRVSGSGFFYSYANEGTIITNTSNLANSFQLIVLARGLNRLLYKLSVANDDFDLYCNGYVVEVPR